MTPEDSAIAVRRRMLGEKLATLRKASPMTQAQLAAATFCDRTRIAHLEHGRGNADLRFWQAADDLLDGQGVLLQAEAELRMAQAEETGARQAAERTRASELVNGWRSGGQSPINGFNDELVMLMQWLDVRAEWPIGETGRRVRQLIAAGIPQDGSRTIDVPRSRVAQMLGEYYRDRPDCHGLFAARIGRTMLMTSVLVDPTWLDLGIELVPERDHVVLTSPKAVPAPAPIRGEAALHAVRRLALTAAGRVRVADVPIYRLLGVGPLHPNLTASMALTSFAEYALTLDLLEGELHRGAIASDAHGGATPLRNTYLPDVMAVLATDRRMCAGGALAVFAIARPPESGRDGRDFAILVQRRSRTVVNAAGTLSVVPKGFHKPIVDYREDARVGTTLMRELEEELFGRADVDVTEGPQRAAAPMHPSRRSEPLRWLLDDPGRLLVESTGFGLNLVSGNYEFANLIVVQDETFWTKFGGMVEANWESDGLVHYSTKDADLLEALAADESWSNEGLFALILGLRRLRELDPERTSAMACEWSLA